MQTLLVALLAGFTRQSLGRRGEPVLRGVGHVQKLVFTVLTMMLWLSPVGALGTVLRVSTGFNVFKLARYLGKEYLLIVATSSSESALPRLITKMEHVGVERTTVAIVVPTGYSFNLDGTAIYLTMASLFIADALDKPLHLGEQIGLLLFMIVASKGAAGVSGAGLATLAGGLQSHRPDLHGHFDEGVDNDPDDVPTKDVPGVPTLTR